MLTATTVQLVAQCSLHAAASSAHPHATVGDQSGTHRPVGGLWAAGESRSSRAIAAWRSEIPAPERRPLHQPSDRDCVPPVPAFGQLGGTRELGRVFTSPRSLLGRGSRTRGHHPAWAMRQRADRDGLGPVRAGNRETQPARTGHQPANTAAVG